MKILYFHQYFSTPAGSTGTRSYEMARRLVARGHEVLMVCGSYQGSETGLSTPFAAGKRCGVVDGIDVIEFDLAYSNADGLAKRSLTFITFALRSVALALTQQYDVVFATSTPLTAGIPGIFARWLRKKQFVFEVRDLWPELPRAMGVIRNPFVLTALSVLEWVSYRSAHRLVGLSPGIVAGIVRRGVKPDKVALVPNGCDLGIFDRTVPAWRPDGAEPTDLLALFAGTHGVANGLDAVLDCAAQLKQRQRFDIKLLLIGGGKLKPALQARATREGLNNVLFCAPVSKDRLAGLMAGCDLGLQILADVPAFYFGTSPNKFFDYIAAGLPVLNNYPGWLAEIIVRERCGYAVPPRNVGSFASALEAAANNKDALRAMGFSARRLAERDFDRVLLSNQWVNWVTNAEAASPNTDA